MIIVGIGANLDHPDIGSPRRTCGAALARLEQHPVRISGRSRWYESEPVIRDAAASRGPQPWYVNGAVAVETGLEPEALLAVLLAVEEVFGRQRSVPDAPRTIDLDVLAFDDRVIDIPNLTVPHPRLHQRSFALLPIADLAPDWRHPVTGEAISGLIAALGDDQAIRPMADANGYLGTEWSVDADPSP